MQTEVFRRNTLFAELQGLIHCIHNLSYAKVSTMLPVIFFLFDYFTNSLLYAPIFLSLLCWYFVTVYQTNNNQHHTALITLFLLGLQSFIFTGYFGLLYIGTVPATLLCIYLKTKITHTPLIPGLSALLALMINNQVYMHILGHSTGLPSYTIWQFFVTIVIVMILSLKIQGTGKLGNRLSL